MPRKKPSDRLNLTMIDLEGLFSVSKTTITRYLRDGMSELLLSHNPKIIDAGVAVDWYVRHEVLAKQEKKDIDDELKQARKEKIDLETAKLRGELISVDALDDSQAALAGLLVSQYRQLLIQLPHEFNNPKTKKKLRKVLDRHFKKNVNELRKLLEANKQD